MSLRSIAIGVGCVLITVQSYAEGSATNLLSKSELGLLDKNRNGMLEYKELANLPKAQSEAALDAYDINSDGEISSTEFERPPRTKESMEQEAKRLEAAKAEEARARKQAEQQKQMQKKKAAPKPAPKKEEVKQAPKKKPDPKQPPKKPAPKPDPKKKVQK